MRLTICASLLLSLTSLAAMAADTPTLSTSGKFDQQSGEALFASICQGCHMDKAQGAQGAGAYPVLAGNAKLAASPYVAFMVMNGQGGMPGFAEYLDDQQVTEVVNYVRTHFGNHYQDKISLADVQGLHKK